MGSSLSKEETIACEVVGSVVGFFVLVWLCIKNPCPEPTPDDHFLLKAMQPRPPTRPKPALQAPPVQFLPPRQPSSKKPLQQLPVDQFQPPTVSDPLSRLQEEAPEQQALQVKQLAAQAVPPTRPKPALQALPVQFLPARQPSSMKPLQELPADQFQSPTVSGPLSHLQEAPEQQALQVKQLAAQADRLRTKHYNMLLHQAAQQPSRLR